MHPYDTNEDPPLPLVMVRVHDPVSEEQVSLPGKLDTGSGISILPEKTVAELGLEAQADVWVAGYDEMPKRLPAYFVAVTLAGHTVTKLRVTASPRRQMLIGRDVLSHFVATFDGKNQTFDLIDP